MAHTLPAPTFRKTTLSALEFGRPSSSEGGDAYRLARRRGLTHEDAEDIAQDTRLRVWQAGPHRVDSVLPYCIAQRVLASFLRREFAGMRDRRRLLRLPAIDESSDPAGDPCPPELDPRHVLDRLTRSRTACLDVRVLRLRLEGNSYRTIAERVGRKVHDVTNCLHRIKKTLRAQLSGS